MIAYKGYILYVHNYERNIDQSEEYKRTLLSDYSNDLLKFYLAKSVQNSGLTDYKFYCFNGNPKYLYVSEGLENHATASISFLTLDWKFAEFFRTDYRSFKDLPQKPMYYKEMLDIAKLLSKGHAFLRVDLYEISNIIYFSELTFSPCSGFMPFTPSEWDLKLGQELILNDNMDKTLQ